MLAGFAYTYHLPQLKSWILFQVAEYTRLNGPVYAFAETIDFSVFPLGIRIRDVKLVPKAAFKETLKIAQIEEIRAGLDPLTFFGGRFGISEIALVGLGAKVILPDSAEPTGNSTSAASKKSLPDLPIKEIVNLPIHRIRLDRFSIELSQQNSKYSANISNGSLLIDNKAKALTVTLALPAVNLQQADSQVKIEPVSLNARLVLSPLAIQLSSLKLQRAASYIYADGRDRKSVV